MEYTGILYETIPSHVLARTFAMYLDETVSIIDNSADENLTTNRAKELFVTVINAWNRWKIVEQWIIVNGHYNKVKYNVEYINEFLVNNYDTMAKFNLVKEIL